MFVPWQDFLADTSGDVNAIWERYKQLLPRRLAAVVGNIQLLQRSAEDAKRDARQWAAQSGEPDPMADAMDFALGEGESEEFSQSCYRPGDINNAIRLIDVLRSNLTANQITKCSYDASLMVQQLCKFQQVALVSPQDLLATKVHEPEFRTLNASESVLTGTAVPEQAKVKSIKSQQASASRERERMIQGIQVQAYGGLESHSTAIYRVFNEFGEDNIEIVSPSSEEESRERRGPTTSLRLGASTSFLETGKQIAASFTLNKRQSISLMLLCRHLDRVHKGENGVHQLCQFIGGQGGTGKSRIIEAIIALFASKGMAHRLLVTAMSGTAAARINGITIHAACNLSMDSSNTTLSSGSSRVQTSSLVTGLRVDGQRRMYWLDKDMLIIDEISMLGARTLHAVNEQLCMFRGRTQDFGGIPVVLFLGDFRQFRPVQERSILVPSSGYPWDEGKTFKVEQRRQHDKAHMLWKRFTTVIMLNEQVRAAGDPQLQRLLMRIREGTADRSDVDLLNRTCYQEGRRVPWETGITVVTTLNRHRWRLNVEGTLSYQRQHKAELRIFISEHKWKGGPPTEEEALMIMGYGDDSSVPVPAIFMFVLGMPVVVNKNTYTSLKLVNGSDYHALDVVIDRDYPGYRVSAHTILHFGPPAGIILAAESTRDFNFVGMPHGTILLTPLSSKMECMRKRPWQSRDVTRRGLPCTAAFACTDYKELDPRSRDMKSSAWQAGTPSWRQPTVALGFQLKVQGRTLERVALELRGSRTVQVDGQTVYSQCDPYSLYVQLSRSPSLQGIMLLSKVRERDIIGNTVSENMVAAEKRLEELSMATIQDAEMLDLAN